MLAEIDKDARNILALQEENCLLHDEVSTLRKTTAYLKAELKKCRDEIAVGLIVQKQVQKEMRDLVDEFKLYKTSKQDIFDSMTCFVRETTKISSYVNRLKEKFPVPAVYIDVFESELMYRFGTDNNIVRILDVEPCEKILGKHTNKLYVTNNGLKPLTLRLPSQGMLRFNQPCRFDINPGVTLPLPEATLWLSDNVFIKRTIYIPVDGCVPMQFSFIVNEIKPKDTK